MLFMGAAFFLAYRFALPVLIEKRLEKRLKREVSLGRVSLRLLQGIELYDLVIYDRTGGERFLHAGKLCIDYHFDQVIKNLKERGKDFKGWEVTLKATSPEMVLRGFRLKGVYLAIQLENYQLTLKELRANLCQGNLKGSFDLDLVSSEYVFQGDISQFDLKTMVEELSFSKKEVQGILEAKLSLKGNGAGLNNLSGHGHCIIREGKLWEFPFLGGLVVFLRVPYLEKVAFREGKANFTILDGIVMTRNLTLISDQVKLLAKGRIDFQGKIKDHIMVEISFSKGFLDDIPLIGEILSFVIDEAGKFIAQVEVTGSIKEPKYRLVPLAGGIRDLLGIFGVYESD